MTKDYAGFAAAIVIQLTYPASRRLRATRKLDLNPSMYYEFEPDGAAPFADM
jgi:hypothetical protein